MHIVDYCILFTMKSIDLQILLNGTIRLGLVLLFQVSVISFRASHSLNIRILARSGAAKPPPFLPFFTVFRRSPCPPLRSCHASVMGQMSGFYIC